MRVCSNSREILARVKMLVTIINSTFGKNHSGCIIFNDVPSIGVPFSPVLLTFPLSKCLLQCVAINAMLVLYMLCWFGQVQPLTICSFVASGLLESSLNLPLKSCIVNKKCRFTV